MFTIGVMLGEFRITSVFFQSFKDWALFELKSFIPYSAIFYIIARSITAFIYGTNFSNKERIKLLKKNIHGINQKIKKLEKSNELEKTKENKLNNTNSSNKVNYEVKEVIPEIPVFDRYANAKVKTLKITKYR